MVDQSSQSSTLPESIFESGESITPPQQEVQDIFSDVDDANANPSLPPVASRGDDGIYATQASLPVSTAQSSSTIRLALIVGGGVVVLGLIAFVAYMLITSLQKSPVVTTPTPIAPVPATTPETPLTPSLVTPDPIDTTIPTQNNSEQNGVLSTSSSDQQASPAPLTPPALDTDGDGLTDEEERALGTSPTLVDTDNDGLSDFDEVRVYGTNPLNADTDNDGFLDGEEVRNGYNPNGPGRLFAVPSQP